MKIIIYNDCLCLLENKMNSPFFCIFAFSPNRPSQFRLNALHFYCYFHYDFRTVIINFIEAFFSFPIYLLPFSTRCFWLNCGQRTLFISLHEYICLCSSMFIALTVPWSKYQQIYKWTVKHLKWGKCDSGGWNWVTNNKIKQ